MCDIDLEPCDVWREEMRKARKPHRCSCCGGAVVIGDRYISHFSKFDGSITSENLCLSCDRDRDMFAAAHEHMSPTPSHFPQMLADCIHEGDPESMTKWAPMLARIQERAHQVV